MHKTSVVIDDRKLGRARRVLGTTGIRDTIDRALEAVITTDQRARAITRVLRLEGIDRKSLLRARHDAWR